MAKLTLRLLAKKLARALVGTLEGDVEFLRFRDGFLAVVASESAADDLLTLAEDADGQTEVGMSRKGEIFCVLHRGQGDLDTIIPLYEDRVHSPGAYEAVDYRDSDERTIKKFAASLGLLED